MASQVGTVFIATDAMGHTSTTYAMKGTQKAAARRAFKSEVLAGLRGRYGLRVVMFENPAPPPLTQKEAGGPEGKIHVWGNTNGSRKLHGLLGTSGGAAEAALSPHASNDRLKALRAAMDLLACSRARLFVHMYGTFGRDADELDGCKGARAGAPHIFCLSSRILAFLLLIKPNNLRSSVWPLNNLPLSHYFSSRYAHRCLENCRKLLRELDCPNA